MFVRVRHSTLHNHWGGGGGGGRLAQSVERATPGDDVVGSIPAVAARPYWLGRCQYNVTGLDRSHGYPALSRVWQHVKLSDASLRTRPLYSLFVDEDVKKPNKQTDKNAQSRMC